MQQTTSADDDSADTRRIIAQDRAPDDEGLSYEDMMVLSFGLMDPCDWAATLSANLLIPAQKLRAARGNQADPTRDITRFSEADGRAAIRSEAAQFLADLHGMLSSMPIMQSQPVILEALQFILAGVADIDRGAAPGWLEARPTKVHLKHLEQETEWVPIIASLELLMLDRSIASEDAAAKEVSRRTSRKVGTIKDWHLKLYKRRPRQRPMAFAAIQEQLSEVRERLKLTLEEDRSALIERRVRQLLKKGRA